MRARGVISAGGRKGPSRETGQQRLYFSDSPRAQEILKAPRTAAELADTLALSIAPREPQAVRSSGAAPQVSLSWTSRSTPGSLLQFSVPPHCCHHACLPGLPVTLPLGPHYPSKHCGSDALSCWAW